MTPETPIEEKWTPEEKAFYSLLDLGEVAYNAARTLEETQKLMERTGRLVAPEDSRLVVSTLQESFFLIVEKFIPASESSKGYYSQHFSEPARDIPGIKIDEAGRLTFVGTEIEYDTGVNGFYIYHYSGQSRVLHRVGHTTTVQMLPAAIVDFESIDPNLYNAS